MAIFTKFIAVPATLIVLGINLSYMQVENVNGLTLEMRKKMESATPVQTKLPPVGSEVSKGEEMKEMKRVADASSVEEIAEIGKEKDQNYPRENLQQYKEEYTIKLLEPLKIEDDTQDEWEVKKNTTISFKVLNKGEAFVESVYEIQVLKINGNEIDRWSPHAFKNCSGLYSHSNVANKLRKMREIDSTSIKFAVFASDLEEAVQRHTERS